MVSDAEQEPLRVEPLGVFASRHSVALGATPEELRGMVGGLDRDLRRSVASYLRRGALILAIMEYTRDVLDDKFGVSGGSAIVSDGTFYWREDAANYIEEYGIAVPDDVVSHMRDQGWVPPVLDEDTKLRIDQYLWNELGVHDKDGQPAPTGTWFYPRST